MPSLYLIVVIVAVLFVTFASILSRYKRCPSDKILVVYGKTGRNKEGGVSSARCIHGGAAFIWPVFQNYAFLDLTPISIECNLTNALSKQNIRVDVPCRFTVGISTEPESMTNAAERLLGQNTHNIQNIATDILFGQLRLVIATMDIEEINADRDKFLANVSANVEAELRKIGLKLINVNVTDIRDESGYIEALGKEAAAKAIVTKTSGLQKPSVIRVSVRPKPMRWPSKERTTRRLPLRIPMLRVARKRPKRHAAP